MRLERVWTLPWSWAVPYLSSCLSQVQLHTSNTFGVTALQSSNTDFYSKHWENKLQVLTKTVVTFEYSAVLTWNLHYHVCHELGMDYLVNNSCYPPSSLQIQRWNPWRKNWLFMMSCELTAITDYSIGSLQSDKDFQGPLE